MKIKHAREALAAYDGEADLQICVLDEEGQGQYFDVGKIVPLMGAKDAILEVGEFRCG